MKEAPSKKDFLKSMSFLAIVAGVFILLSVAAGAEGGLVWNLLFYAFLVASGAYGYHRYLTRNAEDGRMVLSIKAQPEEAKKKAKTPRSKVIDRD